MTLNKNVASESPRLSSSLKNLVTSEKHYYHESISSQSKEPDSIKEFQKALEQYEQKEEILFRHRNKQWKSDKNTIRELGKYVNECLEKRLQRRMTTRSMTRLQEQDDVLTPEERESVESYMQPVMDALAVEKRLQKELTTFEKDIATRFKWSKFEGSLRL